jgi:hypothetical protein
MIRESDMTNITLSKKFSYNIKVCISWFMYCTSALDLCGQYDYENINNNV